MHGISSLGSAETLYSGKGHVLIASPGPSNHRVHAQNLSRHELGRSHVCTSAVSAGN